MPPRPTDPPGAEPRQPRISTGLAYPDQASEALQLAEQLGNALERHRLGLEPFDWVPWLPRGRQPKPQSQGEEPADLISGGAAIRLTREWWGRQRRRHQALKTSREGSSWGRWEIDAAAR